MSVFLVFLSLISNLNFKKSSRSRIFSNIKYLKKNVLLNNILLQNWKYFLRLLWRFKFENKRIILCRYF